MYTFTAAAVLGVVVLALSLVRIIGVEKNSVAADQDTL